MLPHYIGPRSEGKSLTDDDDKTYWGEISYMENEHVQDKDGSEENGSTETTMDKDSPAAAAVPPSDDHKDIPKRLQVKGSVMYGWGLEPQPMARFIMRERVEEDLDDGEEEEEEDTTEEDLERTFSQQDESDDNIDWANAFQWVVKNVESTHVIDVTLPQVFFMFLDEYFLPVRSKRRLISDDCVSIHFQINNWKISRWES